MSKLRPYLFPFATSLLFALAIFAGVTPQEAGAAHGRFDTSFVANALLAVAFFVLAAWFLHAFTHADPNRGDGTCQAEQRASMFRFAYMFALFSFALLLLPFTAMMRPVDTTPDAGPIRLLRACVEARPATGQAPAAAPVEHCSGADQSGFVSYPWLVSVGGVVARNVVASAPASDAIETRTRSPAQPMAPAAAVVSNVLFADSNRAATAVAVAAPADDVPAVDGRLAPLYRVQGGFVVPFYVVVFAFVGGVVNLSRRVPEYQKRSSCDFAGTPAESCVSLLEAREFVVFQLMQLVSSPFISMVAYYALEPKSVASAVGIAFFSGFATESVLLVLRGMFSGLQPATTKTTAAANALTAQLQVLVRRTGGQPAPNARVELRRRPEETAPLKTEVTGATGEAAFRALPPGTVWVAAIADQQASQPAAVNDSQQVQLRAGETAFIELTLA